ncbi:23703_t:CDS:1 [Racocetra persica]|uniref:23703_t:CDS:1 n=1 Tax=Racocetra persica TaxID=160502 RepID=A0ACA9PPB0_9GLOM|nr:23703_t:CDS:1 [Racocetra persica]
MTIANLKEYARLSMAIKKARQEGKNPTELLIQRQKLIIIGPPRKEPKSRTEINRNYYQRNKEILQEQATINKAKKQEQEQERREQEVKELAAKLYEANSIKVLMSFKQYTELKKGKKLWLDFSQTLQDLTAGVGDIISIMKLREVSENLISDY